MASTVPSETSARQPKSHSTQYQLSALSLVSAVVIHGVTEVDLAWTVVVILVVVLVVAVFCWLTVRRVKKIHIAAS